MQPNATVVPLQQAADVRYLSQLYPPPVAQCIAQHVGAFIPYASNFPGTCAVQRYHYPSARDALVLEMTLNSSGPATPVRVALTFPAQYPQQVIQASVVATRPGESFKQPYSVMNANGEISVENLSFLRNVARPYGILDVLMALSEQFQLDCPLVTGAAAPSITAAAAAAPAVTPQPVASDARVAMIQDAAEKVVINLHERAGSYLETREQSMKYLQKMNESNRELSEARDMLLKRQAELCEYMPSMGNVSALLKQLNGHQDTIEEHAACLVPADATQARVLELIADIHATDDTLGVLENGLKAEQLSCDDYVKYVSDVGREQFASRFLLARAIDSMDVMVPPSVVAPPQLHSPAPSVPKSRASPGEVLRSEFGKADPDLIRDVLASVQGDVDKARQQLAIMFC